MYILHQDGTSCIKFGSYAEDVFYERLNQAGEVFYASCIYDLLVDTKNRQIGIRLELHSEMISDLFETGNYHNVILEKVINKKFFTKTITKYAHIFSSVDVNSSDYTVKHVSENCEFYLPDKNLWDLYLLDLAPADLDFVVI